MDGSEEFEQLKAHFGHEGNAQQLTFSQFIALPDSMVEGLLKRPGVSIAVAGRLAELRQHAKAQQQLMTPTAAYVPAQTVFEVEVMDIPLSLIPEDDASCHASTMFDDPDVVKWFQSNLVMPINWELEHPNDVPPNSSHNLNDHLDSFQKMGYKVWNVENKQHATSYLKVTSKKDKSIFITLAGRADYLITKREVGRADYLNRILCVIEVQSKSDIELCEYQIQVYLLILMNSKHLPALVGFLVLKNGLCRAFKATRDEDGSCLFEMNDMFHVTYIAEVMDKVLREARLID